MLRAGLVPFILCGLMWGCGGDDPPAPRTPSKTLGTYFADNDIIVSDIRGIPANAEVDKIKVEISGIDWQVIDALEASYADGRAVLSLPVGFASEGLMKAARENASDYTGFWPAAANDPDAKVAELKDIFAYHNGKKVGRVFLTDWSDTGSNVGKYFVKFHYADRDYAVSGYNFTMNGNQKSFEYRSSFRTGWNVYASVNRSDGGIALITTSIPADRELFWRFESYVY